MIFLIGIIYLAAVAFAMREVSKELQRRDGNKGMLWNGRELSERTMGIGHRPRMKFLTPFSCEETLERLSSMCAPFDCTFTKECADEKDCMYVLDVQELPLWCYGLMRCSIKYRVLVTPAQEGSAVWLFPFAFERGITKIDVYSNTDMKNIFAWEVGKVFEKLLNAVRVE